MTTALTLGATLYMPATREDVLERLFGPRRVLGLRSAVLCLEDSILDRDSPWRCSGSPRRFDDFQCEVPVWQTPFSSSAPAISA